MLTFGLTDDSFPALSRAVGFVKKVGRVRDNVRAVCLEGAGEDVVHGAAVGVPELVVARQANLGDAQRGSVVVLELVPDL